MINKKLFIFYKQKIFFSTPYRRGLDINNVALVYIFFGDQSYVEYRKESIINWDSLLGELRSISVA